MNYRSIGVAFATAALLLTACGKDATGPDDEEPPPENPDTVASPATEGRALWVSRFDWSDQAQLRAMIDSAAAANFNIIYLQVRARSDAYYRSNLEAWAPIAPVNTRGVDPGWDPLAVAVAAAHAKGVQVHAWLNALIGWCGTAAIPETTPRHILLTHPEWVLKDQAGSTYVDGCNFLTPGDPGVRTWLARVSADIARNYAVDGIHLDYIRYPYATWGYDQQTVTGYETAKQTESWLTFDEYRRRMVTYTVREVHDSLQVARPRTVLSAAVWGVYRNTAGWSGIASGYDARLQDSRGWLQQGIIDVIAPMIYWPITPVPGERLDFGWLADDFASNRFGRHVYIGMGGPWAPDNFCMACDVVKQIYRARRAQAQGVSVFSGQIVRGLNLWNAIRTGPFKAKVPVPAMPWMP